MEDLKKIRIMTNLAIYDKNYGEEDRKITSHYKRDYVYKKNLGIRIGVLLGSAVIIMLYYCYKLFVIETDMFTVFNKAEAIKMGIAVVVLLVVYTIIGTIINGERYSLAEERCLGYQRMLCKLNGKKNIHNTNEDNTNERT
ncbi:MAG TPA: hypothetical protein DIC60_03390 [Lachnospiraceae bacterium]|nr:hypothetical protein [Lachnospiraceae bacterium]